MADQLWTILSTVDGSVVTPVFTTSSTNTHPKDQGYSWDSTKMRATRIDVRPTKFQSWTGTAWADDLALLKADAIQRLKDEAEQLKMMSMTTGGAKKEEYAANKAEVRDADQLGGALLTVLSNLRLQGNPALEARFPQAAANAAEFGDAIPDALNRFRGGIARSAPCPRISAREHKVCTDIRAASTIAAFNAVLAKHKWPS